MSDGKQPNQAMGGSDPKDASDGIKEPAGWSGGGESGGGARPENATGAGDGGSHGGFFGHGGQSHIGYSGTGDEDGEKNDNAATSE